MREFAVHLWLDSPDIEGNCVASTERDALDVDVVEVGLELGDRVGRLGGVGDARNGLDALGGELQADRGSRDGGERVRVK